MLKPRCKICPDSISESADIVASDARLGGGPEGEDPGFNGIILRTKRRLDLFEAAKAAGVIAAEPGTVSFRDFDRFQPHHVRKKRAVWARLAGMKAAGMPVFETENLRIEACARLNSVAMNLAEARGSLQRARRGALGEPPAVARPSSARVRPPSGTANEDGPPPAHSTGPARSAISP